MENVNKIIRNKNVQYFISFSAFLLAFGFSIIPLIDASPSPFSSQVETTVVANHQHEEETQNNEKLDKSLVAQVAAVETEASVKLYQEPNTQQFPIAEVKKGNMYSFYIKSMTNGYKFNSINKWLGCLQKMSY